MGSKREKKLGCMRFHDVDDISKNSRKGEI